MSYPSGSASTNRSRPTAAQASRTSSSDMSVLLNAMFSLMVPLNTQVSWRTTENISLTWSVLMSLRSIPSTRMDPESTS